MSAPIGFLLASASPARAATLRAAGIEPVIITSEVDEGAVLAELLAEAAVEGVEVTPSLEVEALARAKARAVFTVLPSGRKFASTRQNSFFLMGCDTMLQFKGEMLGKPHAAEIAEARIKELRGNDAVLWTGHHAMLLERKMPSDCGEHWTIRVETTASAQTIVHFDDISDEEIAAYVATGEPLNVAGSFTIDGYGGAFLRGVTGDPHSVVGISLPLVRQMATSMGIFWPDLWEPRGAQ